MARRKAPFMAVVFILGALCGGFEFPQPALSSADISVFFGQSLIETFSGGLTFAKPDGVKAAEAGRLLIAMDESYSPFAFSSTLGKTVIIGHEDKMISVYGNMEKIELPQQTSAVSSGQPLGTSGKSAWQQKEAGLIFLTCDTKNLNGFNPFILLPQFEKSFAPLLRSIVLVNRRGTVYELSQTKSLPADTYLLYREQIAGDTTPYRAVVLVNGIEADTADFNVLRQNDSYLELAGKRSFPFSVVYPFAQRQLLASLTLSKGRTVISVSVSDIAENTRTLTYTVEAQ